MPCAPRSPLDDLIARCDYAFCASGDASTPDPRGAAGAAALRGRCASDASHGGYTRLCKCDLCDFCEGVEYRPDRAADSCDAQGHTLTAPR